MYLLYGFIALLVLGGLVYFMGLAAYIDDAGNDKEDDDE